MGSGSSSNPVIGVPANPRVMYNDMLSRKEKQPAVLDAPVLVDVQHGSIRYRYNSYDGEPERKVKRTERPYEETQYVGTKITNEGNQVGTERPSEETQTDTKAKQHYFYHARLGDFSQGADRSKEDDFKFVHVIKGPGRAQQKKLYYVYGRGMDAVDGARVKPTQTKDEGADYSWPGLRVPNHLYYRLSFQSLGGDNLLPSAEDRAIDELKSTPDKSSFKFTLTSEERTRELRAKIAVKILKAASDIHICFENLELRDQDVVGDYRSETERLTSEVGVELKHI